MRLGLSIVIPTLNEGSYLAQLLDSIRKQRMEGLEIIVADGGSQDATVAIAKRGGCYVVKEAYHQGAGMRGLG